MFIAWLRNTLARDRNQSPISGRTFRRGSTPRPRRTSLAVEALENRLVPSLTVGPNINITKSSASDAETAIAVNPTNIKNLCVVSTAQDIFKYSMDGGTTWQNSNVGSLSSSLGDQQLAWDQFGNLFLTCFSSGNNPAAVVAVSSDGGATFTQIFTGAAGADQPSIAVGAGMVWVDYFVSGSMKAAGAPVTGLGAVGAFSSVEQPGGAAGTFGDIAIGPNGQVMLVYQENNGNGNPSNLYYSIDPDGLGAQGLTASVVVTQTNIGSFDAIPAQPNRTIDAEVNLAWDRTNGPHKGRVYFVYTNESPDESSDTDVFLRHSDDNGATWSAPVRVNDTPLGDGKSQFQSEIALDQTNGDVAITWLDCRNSATNVTTQVFGTVSQDGGATFLPSVQISKGTSDATTSGAGQFNYGDYDKMDFFKGVFYRTWADNSNSTSDNPAGANGALDIYTAQVTVTGTSGGGGGGGGGGGTTGPLGQLVKFYNPVRYQRVRHTNVYLGYITLINYGDTTVKSPAYLVLNNLGLGVGVINASGKSKSGTPFIKVNKALIPEKPVRILVRISNPHKSPLNTFYLAKDLKFTGAVP
jgi:hypothetical protein